MTDNSFQAHNAGFISRFVAFVVDLGIISLVSFGAVALFGLIANFFNLDELPLQLPIGSFFVTSMQSILVLTTALFSTIFGFVYFLFFWVVAGYTPGKALMGLQVVRTNGELLSPGRAILRLVGYWVSALPFFLGFVWIVLDNRRQGWHDKMADSCVVYIKAVRKERGT